MIIRNATLLDITSIVEMAKLMHSQSRFKRFNYDKEKMKELVTNLINNESGILIVMEDVSLVGGIMGIVAEQYFGRDKAATDLGLFVQPDSRNAKIAIKLITEYIKQAKDKGAIDVCIGNSTGRELELVGKLYESLGFKMMGGVYCLEDNRV